VRYNRCNKNPEAYLDQENKLSNTESSGYFKQHFNNIEEDHS